LDEGIRNSFSSAVLKCSLKKVVRRML